MSQIISVIIPVYNGEKFIARAIDSVLKQTLPADEIIVINDGSKDGTEKVLEQFKDKIIYKTIPNGGVSNARNVGIELSRGDWIAFLDADDVWYPHKLERQLACLQQHPSVGFSCCNYTVYNSAFEKVVNHFLVLKDNSYVKFDCPVINPLPLLIQENFVGTCSNVIVQRDVLQKAGRFNTTYHQAEDYDLWLRCAFQTEFLFMEQVLLDKNSHETNLTNNQLQMCQCHQRVLKDLLVNHSLELKERKLVTAIGQALAAKSYQTGNIFYERGELKAGFAQYWQGLMFSWTARNMLMFLWVLTKKLLRTITGGVISKRNLARLKSRAL